MTGAIECHCHNCGRRAWFSCIVSRNDRPQGLPPSDDGDEISVDIWTCGCCGSKNLVPLTLCKETED